MRFVLSALALCLAITASAAPITKRVVDGGVAIDVTLDPRGKSGELREGEDVGIRVAVADATTGQPLTGIRPAIWINRRSAENKGCVAGIADYLSGSLFTAADVDLNTFYVVVMNGDGTVSVVDPRFSFGGTRFLSLIALPAVGHDWTLAAADSRLFVTMPEANKVAVIDTASWSLIGNLDAGAKPERIGLQGDDARLWITNADGVAVVDARKLDVVARIATGRGPHLLAVSNDDTLVTNEQSLSVIDTRKLKASATIDLPAKPISLAWSPLGRIAYVRTDGALLAIDPKQRKVVATVKLESGTGDVRVSPNGRYAFATNRNRNLIEIVDTATNRVIQTADIEHTPDQITFSDNLVYVRQEKSDQVLMIPFESLGKDGGTVNFADFPGGQRPFGAASRRVAASGLSPVPGEAAMLVANPADGEIYFYKEGMAAPMGQFRNDSREPLAVLAVDRGMRERAPGRFENVARLPMAGNYEVSILIDAPRVTACFPITAAVDPIAAAKRDLGAVKVTFVLDTAVKVGQQASLRVQLADLKTQEPRRGLNDVRALVFQAPGVWHQRILATPTDDGSYRIAFTPPDTGVYYVYVESETLSLKINNPQYAVVQASR